MSLGGGLRKVRVAREGSGKAAVIAQSMCSEVVRCPLFLMTVYAKNEKGSLTKAEQAATIALSKQLLAIYGAKA